MSMGNAKDDTTGLTASAQQVLDQTRRALGVTGAPAGPETVRMTGDEAMASAFDVTEFAAGAVAAAASGIADLAVALGQPRPAITVDRRLTALWYGTTFEPVGWTGPATWDAIAGDYAGANGWIRLHTNAPHHKAAALTVLGLPSPGSPEADRATVAAAVAQWDIHALETAVVENKGCAAAMRTVAAWRDHPQGAAVAQEPLIALGTRPAAGRYGPSGNAVWQPRPDRPLAGLRVLDLTRILAGPVATRFLAGFGAEVLRIDPIGWEEDSLAPEVTLGKRCARLDLRQPTDRATFERLLAAADVIVHGYRADALENLGFGAARRAALSPGVIDVTLDAYGWSGPWHARRGFDSLVQMSAGIAAAGMAWKQSDRPVPLPVQALDHATGYLIAAAVLEGLVRRVTRQEVSTARLSLARTAWLLHDCQQRWQSDNANGRAAPALPQLTRRDSDFAVALETTAWGEVRRCRPPVDIAGIPLAWTLGANRLGSAHPEWTTTSP